MTDYRETRHPVTGILDGYINLDLGYGLPIAPGQAEYDALAVRIAAGYVPLPALSIAPIKSNRGQVDVTITTTTVDPTILYSHALPPLTMIAIDMEIHAISRTNGAVKAFWRRAKVKRLQGNAILIGSVRTPTPDESEASSAAWMMTPSFSGTSIVITVAGADGQTIDWLLFADIRRFTPGGIVPPVEVPVTP